MVDLLVVTKVVITWVENHMMEKDMLVDKELVTLKETMQVEEEELPVQVILDEIKGVQDLEEQE